MQKKIQSSEILSLRPSHIREPGINLSGGVNFYESDVHILIVALFQIIQKIRLM